MGERERENGSRKLNSEPLWSMNISSVCGAGFICIKHSNYLHTSREEREPSSGSLVRAFNAFALIVSYGRGLWKGKKLRRFSIN